MRARQLLYHPQRPTPVQVRAYERIVQIPLPLMPIERGRLGAGPLAYVRIANYADHLPLHRQSEMYAR